jgi:thioredoxin reductase (NADPH)
MPNDIPDPAGLRYDQMHPKLSAREIERARSFGQLRHYADGELLFRSGQTAPGLFIVLDGVAVVTQSDEFGEAHAIVERGPGEILGEIGQLSGTTALLDGRARGRVEALVLAPDRIRLLLLSDAELGERIMRAIILRRVMLMERRDSGAVILGAADDPEVVRLQGFLERTGFPWHGLAPERDAGAQLVIARLQVAPEDLPVVICPGGQILRRPSNADLARCLGLLRDPDPARVFDVAIIGAGPAGLATAVYAGSEGLSALLLDARAPGGQAGASARIENYLGFPAGIAGQALTTLAWTQALKFGVESAIPTEVRDMSTAPGGRGARFELSWADGRSILSRAVVIATGAQYRRPDVPELDAYLGRSVHYWASPVEGRLCEGAEVVVVGGGNSAGQAVAFLAARAAQVRVLVRAPDLQASMSRYLIERISAQPNVTIVTECEVVGLTGQNGMLRAVQVRDRRRGTVHDMPATHMFLFIGADPNSGWLPKCGVALDERGFVLTGAAARPGAMALETSLPGVFAIGDVRSGSTKRVAAGVGEGAQVVALLHGYLDKRNQAIAAAQS